MNRNIQRSNEGSSIIVVILAVTIIVVVGLFVWHKTANSTRHRMSTTQPMANNSKRIDKPMGKYSGWKVATSPRADFTIKYPADWKYNEILGSKDNVEYMTLDSDKIHLTINSYVRDELLAMNQPATTCQDCIQTTKTASFMAAGFGKLTVDTVVYKLDDDDSNAIIVRQPDGTYYIPSSRKTGIVTTFRATSVQPSLAAYQSETTDQFMANADYAVAQQILESLTY